uniref:Uncharacterized protein n=1 Tax=Micrurus carvalhoi TaxID=3147026 RepID=A0A2H6NG13_9SAUR
MCSKDNESILHCILAGISIFNFFPNCSGQKRTITTPNLFLFCLTPIHMNTLTFNTQYNGTYKKKTSETTKTNLLEYLILSPQKHFEILLLITMYIVHYMYNLSLDYLEHQVNQIHGIHQHTKICMRDSHTKPCGSPYINGSSQVPSALQTPRGR